MPAQPAQQLPHRPVIRNRIRHGHDGVEPEHALCIAVYDGATVGLAAPVVVLHVVLAVAVSLPDIHLNAGHGVAGGGLDGAQDEQRVAVGVGGDGEAVGVGGGVVGVEGAEDSALCGVRGLGMVDGVDEEGEADYV